MELFSARSYIIATVFFILIVTSIIMYQKPRSDEGTILYLYNMTDMSNKMPAANCKQFQGCSNTQDIKQHILDLDDTVAKVLVSNPVIKDGDNVCKDDTRTLPLCSEKPIKSVKLNISFDLLSFDELYGRHGIDLSEGGHFRPISCRAKQKVAIVIPYRDRESNLKMLLNNLHPFLKKQDVEYTMFVVEQLPGSNFNRGMTKNIGFFEARRLCRFDCVFFHDIDMTPDDYGNVYQCGPQPRQHSRNLARWGHHTPFKESFGGVVSMKPAQFIKVNGYTNTYFEWGGEDNELGNRVLQHNLKKTTYPFSVSTYQEFTHSVGPKYSLSNYWYKKWKSRLKNDGLTTLHYSLMGVIRKPLFTHIFVNINATVVSNAYHGHIALAKKSDKPLG